MPKMKSKRALMKRIKVTGSGRIKRHHSYMGHLAANKTHKQKRQLRHSAIMDNTDVKRIREILK